MQPNSSAAAPCTDGKTYDVVIVGAGVSGGIIAMELAQRNLQVLILEAGPPIPASRENYLDRYYNAYYKMPESPYPPNPAGSDPGDENVGRATTYDVVFNVTNPDKRFPARGRAPPVHENMAKPLVTVAESIDLYDGDRREVGLEQVNQSRSRD